MVKVVPLLCLRQRLNFLIFTTGHLTAIPVDSRLGGFANATANSLNGIENAG